MMGQRKQNTHHSVRCTALNSQYAAEAEPDGPRADLTCDVADDAVSVELPAEPPPLTPEAARALLRLLLDIRQRRTN
ncbi:hypothetical protein BZB76_5175 [Actinomadura pelletieri DSM 43383]|uniref:Uncharacterized protein n=1 Tax=Actinomadura pelletieri DSM 43383 TaxID=1120940 RepID=A0A495QFR8_9ACTN|nr:hypothetical protein BZB76_5175 [Actinomadura pelletieri DSM 43383]